VQAGPPVDSGVDLRDPAGPPELPHLSGAAPLPLVVVSFHWDCGHIPECGNCWDYYAGELYRLARMSDEERGWRLAGHAHPMAPEIFQWWQAIGVPTFQHFSDVLDHADLYVCDNSSTLYEFASTDRPVVVLNRPEYRRDVDHGGRFWRWANVGLQVDEPGMLADGVRNALADADGFREQRQRVVAEVYAYTDGHATDRAVAAVLAAYEGGYWRAWRERRDPSNPKGPVLGAALGVDMAAEVRALRAAGVPLDAETAARLHGC
jgi:CDP-glycerol:poly(glycerophosphate) glycerophosphotransferase